MSCLNISIVYLFSFHHDSLANLNLLFLVAHVALGGRPDFTSDMKNHTKKQTLFVFIRGTEREMTTAAVGKSSADLNPTTFDLIFPAIWQVIKGWTERHQSTTNRLPSTRIIASLQIVIWKQKHFIHHFINYQDCFQKNKIDRQLHWAINHVTFIYLFQCLFYRILVCISCNLKLY